MRYRRFGNTDLELSELCFGPMRFSAKRAGDDDASRRGIAALHAALAGGVNAIHSSVDYGTQWALERALRDHPGRKDLHHVIKVQTPDYDDDHFDAGAFEQTIVQALGALHAERIAVVQHLQRGPRVSKDEVYTPAADPARIRALPEVSLALVDAFERLRAQGKVGYLATFPHTVGFAEPAMRSGVFQGVVHYFNLLETEIAPLLSELERRGMGFIAIRPLLQGLLTDGRRRRDALGENEKWRRSNWDPWYRLLDRVDDALLAHGRHASRRTAYALKFCLAHPAVTTLVTGMSSPEQAEELIAACDGDYPDRDVIDLVHAVSGADPIPKSSVFG